ncbi:MAG TPA: TetR family transcriptional regulator [Angustibacter sp.]|nr:TetR family transcriptional regulator [Angustibacter sp.]
MSPSTPADPPARGGLRERKKARTRFGIQQEALRLFGEQGYAATTVEQIAEAAEVSPSTFFRYFPTKASLVLTDDFDPVFVDSFRRQPRELTTVAAMRAAVRETFTDVPDDQLEAAEQRNALMLGEPELRGAMAEFLVSSTRQLAEVAAARAGRPDGDPEVLALSGAIMGVMLTSLLAPGLSLRQRIDEVDRQLANLERGFGV